MSETEQDIFSRLNAVIEDWRVDRAASLGQLAEKVEVARSSFEKLVEGGASDGAATRAAEADVARLTTELAAHVEAVANLESRLSESEARIGVSEESLAGERASGKRFEEELSRVVGTLASTREEASLKEGAFEEAISALEQSLVEERAQREALEAELEKMCVELGETREAAEGARESARRIEKLEAELEGARIALRTAGEAFALVKADKTGTASVESEGEAVVAPVAEEVDPSEAMEIDAFDVKGHKKRMGVILVDSGIMTEGQLKEVLADQKMDTQRRFGSFVVEQGYASEEIVARILAAQSRLPFVDLNANEIDPEAPGSISAHLAGLHRCIPVRREGDQLIVAMANPLDLIALEDIELVSKCPVAPVVAAPQRIDEAIARFLPDE